MQENIKQVIVKNTVRKEFKTAPIFQWDTGHVLVFEGFNLPEAFQVHFAFSESGESVPQIGSNDQVTVPDALVEDGRMIYAWLYISTEDAGLTKFVILMPVNRRAKPTHQVPPPVEHSEIEQAIVVLNTAVEKAETAAENAEQSEENASQYAENAYNSSVAAANSAESAEGDARTATAKAQEATSAASSASQSVTDADTAKRGAETAKEAAQGYAGNASIMAQEANQSKNTAVEKAGEAEQSATNAAQSAQAAQQTAQQFSAKISEIDQELNTLSGDVSDLSDSLSEHEQYAEDTYAKQDGYYSDLTAGNAEQLVSSKLTEDQVPYKLRPAGGTNDIGNREYKEAIVGGTIAWNQLVRDEASDNETDYADVVTVDDAVEDAAGVKVKIEPVQDLHGYDHPWPAGGGKNKFPVAEWFTAYDVSQNNLIVGDVSVFLKAGAYSLSLEYYVDGATSVNSFWRTYSEEVTFVVASKQIEYGTLGLNNSATSWTQKTVSFTTTQDGWFAIDNAQLRGGVHYRNIQLEEGSATDFAPYSNICPITGWDGVQVWDDPVRGGNIEWNQNFSNGNFESLDGWRASKGTLAVADNVATITASSSATTNVELFEHPIRQKTIGHKYIVLIEINPSVSLDRISIQGMAVASDYTNYPANTWSKTGLVVTCNVSSLVDIYFYTSSAYTEGDTVQIKNCMLFDLTQMFGEGNEPTTVEAFKALFPADYYPYNAGEITTVSAVNGDPYRHYSITLPTEAGTVYGGELTVNADGSGSLVVDRASVDLGTLTWTYFNIAEHYRFVAYPQGIKSFDSNVLANILCSAYTVDTANNVFNNVTDKRISSGGGALLVYDSNYSSADAFKTAMNGVQLVYLLATPTTYTLSATQVRTLLGTNNVWADTGDLALTYTGTDEHLTLESGKKYFSRISGTDSMLLGSGQEITAAKGTDNVFDLTQMFGTAVADYVYGQGAGFFRKWFGKQWYPYNAGELLSVEGLQSHDMVGFNQWDEEWELGTIRQQDGAFVNDNTRIRSKNYNPCVPNAVYYVEDPTNGNNIAIRWYDADKNFVSASGWLGNTTIQAPENAYYFAFVMASSYGTTYKNDICISLAHNNSRNGEYEPYEKHSYPLDSTVILRGIPKVGANGVYWDGDRYLPDGTVERRYGVVDLGTQVWGKSKFNGISYFVTNNILSDLKKPESSIDDNNFLCTKYPLIKTPGVSTAFTDKTFFVFTSGYIYVRDDSFTDLASFKSAMQGVLLVYELATPTTETAQPYRELQIVDDWGTEEFVTTGLVPVGHETQYPANLRDKLQHLPDLASSNGIYIVKQTDSEMELLKLPDMPTTNGNYRLKLNVASGSPTFSWEVVS